MNHKNSNTDSLKAACERLSNEIPASIKAKAILKVSNLELIPASADLRISTEVDLRAQIDAACVHWSYHRSFPRLDPYLATFLFDRLVLCASFARYLHNAGFRLPDKSEDEALAWLLVEHWKIYGVQIWKSQGGSAICSSS